MPLDRRTFLATVGAGLAMPGRLRAQPRPKRYPIAFSTLGCPAWSWKTILEQAERLGYAAIELRGVAGEMDLPKVPELAAARLGETKRELAGRGLVVSDLGASARMHEKDAAARAKNFDEGRRFIDLAHAMGVKYVRMFPDQVPPGEARDDVTARIIEGFQKMAAHAKPAGVVVLVESHGDYTNSKDLERILAGVAQRVRRHLRLRHLLDDHGGRIDHAHRLKLTRGDEHVDVRFGIDASSARRRDPVARPSRSTPRRRSPR